MNMEMAYLMKVSVCMAFFYVLYAVVFRTTTFFSANRIYLLSGLVLSFVVPSLELSTYVPDIHVVSSEYWSDSRLETQNSLEIIATGSTVRDGFGYVIPVVYWFG